MHVLKSKRGAGVLISLHFGRNTVFRKCSMSFSFHLAFYMPDKAVFVTQPLTGKPSNVSSPTLKCLLMAEN